MHGIACHTLTAAHLMSSSDGEIAASVSASLAKLRADMPEASRSFSALAQSATKDGALDKKTKELIAMALSLASRRDSCIGFHAETPVKLGTTPAEFEDMLGMCIYMGGGPSLMYESHAGARHTDGENTNQASMRNRRTCRPDAKGAAQVADTTSA